MPELSLLKYAARQLVVSAFTDSLNNVAEFGKAAGRFSNAEEVTKIGEDEDHGAFGFHASVSLIMRSFSSPVTSACRVCTTSLTFEWPKNMHVHSVKPSANHIPSRK